MRKPLLATILALATLAASPGEIVEEKEKLINVVGVNVPARFAYVALFGLETKACPPIGVLKLGVRSERGKALFSTLLAAKTANRAVTLTLETSGAGCTVRSAIIH